MGELDDREGCLDLEFRLCDQYDNVLAFFSPGHQNGSVKTFPAGEFTLTRTAKLPEGINQGDYYLDITVADPNIIGWVDFYKAVTIHHLGAVTQTGAGFRQGSKNGWLFLENVDGDGS